jgi:PAS domain S-box-containing protein
MEPIEQLDLAALVEVSQAVLGETVLEKLIEKFVRITLEQAGAQRALLIIARSDEYRIEAEGTRNSDAVTVNLQQASVTSADLPESVFDHVVKTKRVLLLQDASNEQPFSTDEYVRRHTTRSILCIPLLRQTRMTGMLYLENIPSLVPMRTAILALLALEAAFSIESSVLYSELRERETKVQRVVGSNIIGICVWHFDGRIIEANDAFLDIVGYTRDDLIRGHMRWTAMTPPEWSEVHTRVITDLRATGTTKPYEKEYFRKNGTRVPVWVGAATFGERQDQGFAFVLNLTERKRAEEDLRCSERRYHEAELELAHANRVATLGQLTASIAHEVNQPIAAVVNHASAALHWLDEDPPNIERIRSSLTGVVGNGRRAGEVMGRIRALLKKVPPQKESMDINEAILEIIALSRGEIKKYGISVRTFLAEGLSPVDGDRVQLQQVILNLVVNAVEALSSVHDRPRELTISTVEDQPNGVRVTIRDSGPGMSAETLEQIFDAFYTTKSGGLGMGLSISRSIIEAHGGHLWAAANEPHGASFEFALPLHPANVEQ